MTTYIGNAYDNNTNPIGLCLGQISPCAKDASACVADFGGCVTNVSGCILTCLFVEAMLGFAV